MVRSGNMTYFREYLAEMLGFDEDYDDEFLRPTALAVATMERLVWGAIGDEDVPHFCLSLLGSGDIRLDCIPTDHGGRHFNLSVQPDGKKRYIYWSEGVPRLNEVNQAVYDGIVEDEAVTVAELRKWFEWARGN